MSRASYTGATCQIGFGGRVVLTLASWGAAVLALLAFWSGETIHVVAWGVLSLLFYGTRRCLDTGAD